MCLWFLKFNFLLPCCWRMCHIWNCRNITIKQMWSKANICLSLPTQQLFPFLSAESIFTDTLSMSLSQQKKSSPRQHSTEILISALITHRSHGYTVELTQMSTAEEQTRKMWSTHTVKSSAIKKPNLCPYRKTDATWDSRIKWTT